MPAVESTYAYGHLWLVNYGPIWVGFLYWLRLCTACLRAHDDFCCLMWIGAIMAWVYHAGLHVLLGSFTADPCVVYNSPVTSIIDSPVIVAYLVATYVGPTTIRQQGVQ